MARNRMIKPGFWTSEQLAECSRDARLIFIGIWNFCDDGGVHPASAKRVKMEVLPGDDVTVSDVEKWIQELLEQGLLREFSHNGADFWYVTGWSHQRIDRPSYSYPGPYNEEQFVDVSSNAPRTVDEPSTLKEGKGSEVKGREGNGSASDDAPARVLPLDCPHQEIINLYHETCPSLRRVGEWTPERQKLLRSRWREKPERQSLDWWRQYFERVAASDFLCGRVDSSDFTADLEWLVRPKNMPKVLEGKYDNNARATKARQPKGAVDNSAAAEEAIRQRRLRHAGN